MPRGTSLKKESLEYFLLKKEKTLEKILSRTESQSGHPFHRETPTVQWHGGKMPRICRDSLGTEFVPRGTSLPEEGHERVLLNKGENSRENSFEADRPIGSPLSKGIPDVFEA